jgi:hypothetical protein
MRWAPRIRKHLIRRLYENDARGIVDEELIDEVASGLAARCASILEVHQAREGRVRCPRCAARGIEASIERPRDPDTPMQCANCGWRTTWREYARSYKRRQLNSGGALGAFQEYVCRYEQARTPREKLLAIDAVIHAFHYSLRNEPDLPTRAAAVNLIDGHLADVLRFLDELTYGPEGAPETAQTAVRWRQDAARLPWDPRRG